MSSCLATAVSKEQLSLKKRGTKRRRKDTKIVELTGALVAKKSEILVCGMPVGLSVCWCMRVFVDAASCVPEGFNLARQKVSGFPRYT